MLLLYLYLSANALFSEHYARLSLWASVRISSIFYSGVFQPYPQGHLDGLLFCSVSGFNIPYEQRREERDMLQPWLESGSETHSVKELDLLAD